MKDALSHAVSAAVDPTGVADARSPETQRILDAALERFAEVGVKRTTIGDIARTAGIDRVTVYRRVGSKDEVVQAVVTREATRLFELVAATARGGASIEERVELGFTSMMEEVRGNAMLARMLKVEPEIVLLQLTTEGGLLLAGAAAATMGFFDEAVEDGLLATTDGMEASAELLVRIVHSYMLTPQALVDLGSHQKVREFARTHLVPMVLHAVPGLAQRP